MDDWAQPLLDVIKAHPDWAAAVMFITAFGESFAFISLLFPGTTVLIAAGTLLSDGTLPYASDPRRRGSRRGAGRLGVLLAGAQLWRRDRPAMAVLASPRCVAETSPVLRAS